MTEYLCPECRTPLRRVSDGELDTWQCPHGHGVGLTLNEFHEAFQDDEVDAIWNASADAPASKLKSPLLGKPMVAVTVLVDDDEIVGNEGPGARFVTLDVCRDEQFLWFEVVDFENMPADLPNPGPTAEDLARMESVRGHAADTVARQVEANTGAIERISYRFGSKAAAVTGADRIFRRIRR